jgi:hypothetical protein
MSKDIKLSAGTAQEAPAEVSELAQANSVSSGEIIRRGQAAIMDQAAAHAWSRQIEIMNALAELRTRAMREADTNRPKGGKYCKIVGRLLRVFQFDRIEKGERSRYFECLENLPAISAWHDSLPRDEQADLNYAPYVLRRWKQALVGQSDDEDDKEEGQDSAELNTAVTAEKLLALFMQADEEEQAKFLASEAVIKDADVFLAILEKRPEIRANLEQRSANQSVSRLKQEVPKKRVGRLSHRDSKIIYPDVFKRSESPESPSPH